MKDVDKLFKEFEEKFGFNCYNELLKIYSSLYMKIETLTKSRDSWKYKYKLKQPICSECQKEITEDLANSP